MRRTTAPADEPVLFGDLPDHLKQGSGAADQAYIESLIVSAREQAEEYMVRALIDQSWTMTLDHWPGGTGDWWEDLHTPTDTPRDLFLELPYAPLSSVTSINTYDTSDVATPIVVNTYFYTDTNSEPGRIVLRAGQTWPVNDRRGARIEIIYVAGYGATYASVPMVLRHGIMLHVGWMYEHRGDESLGGGMFKSGAAQAYGSYRKSFRL